MFDVAEEQISSIHLSIPDQGDETTTDDDDDSTTTT